MHVLGQIVLIANVASDAALSHWLSLELSLFLFRLGSGSSNNQRLRSENAIHLIYDQLLRELLSIRTTKEWCSCARIHISGKNEVSLLLYPIDFSQMFIRVAVADPAQLSKRVLYEPMSPTIGPADKQLHSLIHVLNAVFMFEQCLDHVLVKTHELEVQAHHLVTWVFVVIKL